MKQKLIKGMQGDVQFGQIKSIPDNAVKIDHKPLAYGEVSGHQHCITGDVELFELDGKIFACVGKDGAVLQHIHESNFSEKCWTSKQIIKEADHKPLVIPEGVYEFFIQNAFNPYSKLFEKVVD